MKHTGEAVEVYRIGWWTHRWWPSAWMLRGLLTGEQPNGRHVGRGPLVETVILKFRLIRRPHRPWQAEIEGLRFCRRALTAAGAGRKVQRDAAIAEGHVTGYPIDSPKQLRLTARANARAIRQAEKRTA